LILFDLDSRFQPIKHRLRSGKWKTCGNFATFQTFSHCSKTRFEPAFDAVFSAPILRPFPHTVFHEFKNHIVDKLAIYTGSGDYDSHAGTALLLWRSAVEGSWATKAAPESGPSSPV
jgi:hypothetical protein